MLFGGSKKARCSLPGLSSMSVGEQLEMVCRVLMVSILLTAGTSKLMSDGGFFAYYSDLFQSDLRIVLPKSLVDLYLTLIPFIELTLAQVLLVPRLKPIGLLGWYGFMLSLLVGHYILQEWSSVNQLLNYFFLGFLFQALPCVESKAPRRVGPRRKNIHE